MEGTLITLAIKIVNLTKYIAPKSEPNMNDTSLSLLCYVIVTFPGFLVSILGEGYSGGWLGLFGQMLAF